MPTTTSPADTLQPHGNRSKRAAAEIAGDLGRKQLRILMSTYAESTLIPRQKMSKRTIGKHSQSLDSMKKPIAGYHDHFNGHSKFGETYRHFNAWERWGTFKDNIHLFMEANV